MSGPSDQLARRLTTTDAAVIGGLILLGAGTLGWFATGRHDGHDRR